MAPMELYNPLAQLPADYIAPTLPAPQKGSHQAKSVDHYATIFQ
ncbi:hypothetical protein FLA_2057 [Filimonas lacunae]|nr:hypothetical protein FLA_2057 [Filimonas lacunae]